MSDFESNDSLDRVIDAFDWVVISYADMMCIPSVEPPRSLKEEFFLYKYKKREMGSTEVASGSKDAVPSGSSVVTEIEEVIEEEVTTETVRKESTVITDVALQTISIMTQLNAIDMDHRRRQNESVQSRSARTRVRVNILSNQESLVIDEWEVVPDGYFLGPTRSMMDEFKKARAAKIQTLDREMVEMAEKFNKIDILTINWIKKHAENIRLLPSLSESPESHCPSCNHLLAKKKKNHCKICRTVICPNCSTFVEYKAIKQVLCPNALNNLQSKLQNKYYEMLRLCESCERLIELKKVREERQKVTYPLVEKHQALRDLIEQTRPIVAVFHKINQSLMNGETQYRLADALAMSRRINQLAGVIDQQALDISSTGAEPGSRQAALLAAIKHVAFLYVKDNLSHLRLPTQIQVDEARQKRFELKSSRLKFNKTPIERKVDG